jgi:hypothetical protein
MGLDRGGDPEHRYQLCTDEHCERFPCRVYKDGWRDGHATGYERGYAAGFAEGYEAGYRQGFQEGMAACPRPHR